MIEVNLWITILKILSLFGVFYISEPIMFTSTHGTEVTQLHIKTLLFCIDFFFFSVLFVEEKIKIHFEVIDSKK